MKSLAHKVEHARAMLSAGSYQRAKDLCREVLEKEDDNLETFQVLFDTHMAQEAHYKALLLCNWRLERVPNCVQAHMYKLLPLGHLKRKSDAKDLIQSIRHRFGDHPFHLHQSEILYSHFFKSSRHTLKLLKTAKEKAIITDDWLDNIERMERGKSGQIFASQKLLTQALQRNPQDYDSLHSLAITRFYVGRLFSAVRLARQARQINPKRAAECNEIIFASIVGMIPVFWGAQLFIIWVATVTTRIPWFLRGPFNIGGFFMAFLIQGFVLMPIGMMFGGTMDAPHTGATSILVGVLAVAQFIWIIYLLFGFQHLGQRLSNAKKDVKLSKDY